MNKFLPLFVATVCVAPFVIGFVQTPGSSTPPYVSAVASYVAPKPVAAPSDNAVVAVVMTPNFARKVGEINAAVGRCGFKLRETEQVLSKLPMHYLNQNREDLLGQSWAASNAFNDRYKTDPIKACDQARSSHWGTFK